ncbi:MAG: hypothetical protein WBD30_04980 [Bacteroidota bacterium]
MKRTSLVLFAVLLLASCASQKESARQIFVRGWDFTPYAEMDFLFTPEQYRGDYEALGLIKLTFYPEVKKFDKKETYVQTNHYVYTSLSSGKFLIEEVPEDEMLRTFYRTAFDMGGDAVVSFNSKDERRTSEGGVPITVTEMIGFVIKRRGAFK